jgi:hypothetical protein
MTNQQHPITPPPELVQQWWDDFHGAFYEFKAITNKVFQAGADQGLEACCEWLREAKNHGLGYEYGQELADRYRAARRPKPLSLKEQAYVALDTYIYGNPDHSDKQNTYNIIRRALEALPND